MVVCTNILVSICSLFVGLVLLSSHFLGGFGWADGLPGCMMNKAVFHNSCHCRYLLHLKKHHDTSQTLTELDIFQGKQIKY